MWRVEGRGILWRAALWGAEELCIETASGARGGGARACGRCLLPQGAHSSSSRGHRSPTMTLSRAPQPSPPTRSAASQMLLGSRDLSRREAAPSGSGRPLFRRSPRRPRSERDASRLGRDRRCAIAHDASRRRTSRRARTRAANRRRSSRVDDLNGAGCRRRRPAPPPPPPRATAGVTPPPCFPPRSRPPRCASPPNGRTQALTLPIANGNDGRASLSLRQGIGASRRAGRRRAGGRRREGAEVVL